jgi:DNA-binding MarR family transcriptional regulator
MQLFGPDTTIGAVGDPLLDDSRLTLAGLFFEAHDGLTHVLTRRLEESFGIPHQSFEVLIRLARSPEQHLRMSDLAAQVTMSASGLSRAVDRLESAGYVIREACATDRRTTYAALTDLGREKVEGILPVHLEHLEEEFTGVLSASDQAALDRILRKIRAHVNPQAVRASEFPGSD